MQPLAWGRHVMDLAARKNEWSLSFLPWWLLCAPDWPQSSSSGTEGVWGQRALKVEKKPSAALPSESVADIVWLKLWGVLLYRKLKVTKVLERLLVPWNISGAFSCYIWDLGLIYVQSVVQSHSNDIYFIKRVDICSNLDQTVAQKRFWRNHFQAYTFLCYHRSQLLAR